MHFLRRYCLPPSQRGFTLVESIVVLAIVGIAATATFMLVGQDRGPRFNGEVEETVAELKRMQANARAAKDNQEYGMCFAANGWTSYGQDTNDTADPCAAGFAGHIRTVGLSVATLATDLAPAADHVAFERVTGKPANGTSGTLTFSSVDPERSRTVRIESSGVINAE
ncbi:MAG: type II secretion system GspH family protein [bacterium]|nr:type II secretion system GspH family protein [bacterium]